jgi:opacity protein-like surface antigen
MSARALTASIIVTMTIALAASSSAAAQSAPQNPPPAPKPAEAKADAKAATLTVATLAGKWNVRVDSQGNPVDSTVDIKADPTDAKKFTGTIASQMGEAQLKGEVVDGKLTFSFTMTAGSNGDLNVTFAGTQQKDGSLTGTLNFGQGELTWTAVKAK